MAGASSSISDIVKTQFKEHIQELFENVKFIISPSQLLCKVKLDGKNIVFYFPNDYFKNDISSLEQLIRILDIMISGFKALIPHEELYTRIRSCERFFTIKISGDIMSLDYNVPTGFSINIVS